jgi:hypothetical protein
MRTSLRKGSSLIYIEFTSGDFINSLFGSNFVVHKSDDKLNFEIDLTENYRTQNKSINSYLDIQELSESHEKLSSIQIDEEQVLKNFTKTIKRHPDATFVLTLNIGKLGTFKYDVELEGYNNGFQFNVLNV